MCMNGSSFGLKDIGPVTGSKTPRKAINTTDLFKESSAPSDFKIKVRYVVIFGEYVALRFFRPFRG